jgi:hypothetical protein
MIEQVVTHQQAQLVTLSQLPLACQGLALALAPGGAKCEEELHHGELDHP